jgi:hypothetical protein
MRTKRLIDGLNNSQKIRVIVNGVGFYTTVEGAINMAFRSQRSAVMMALVSVGLSQTLPVADRITGLARTYRVYDDANDSKQIEVAVQVDLV